MAQSHPLRGPLYMVLGTLSFVINDTFLKLATNGLPPFEVLMLRGVAASLWCLPLLLVLGFGPQLRLMFNPRVVLRNLAETFAVLFYVVALANLPIADTIALTQVSPLLVILGSALIWREKIGLWRGALVAAGFVGAVLVAQPTGGAFSVYSVLAILCAVFISGRDLLTRTVPPAIPGLIVAGSAIVIVMVGAGIAHVATEQFVMPTGSHLAYLLGAGLFLIGGHFFIYSGYRIGPTGVVAPFMYLFSFWAVVSGLVVFGQFPNALALAGMLIVVLSGVLIVTHSRRRAALLEGATP